MFESLLNLRARIQTPIAYSELGEKRGLKKKEKIQQKCYQFQYWSLENFFGYGSNVPSTCESGSDVSGSFGSEPCSDQCFGSGSMWIRIEMAPLDPDPDLYWEYGSGSRYLHDQNERKKCFASKKLLYSVTYSFIYRYID